MDDNVEQILIVYSVEGTPGDDVNAAELAARSFRLERRTGPVRVEARTFQFPEAATPVGALSAELKEEMDSSVGALVFVDDLRPNVAYELGYFHGRGRPVLLITKREIDAVWRDISDLAGAALADLRAVELGTAVHDYLGRIYKRDLTLTAPVPLLGLPTERDNFLSHDLVTKELDIVDGPHGACLRVSRFDPPVDIAVGCNLLPGARVRMLVRAPQGTGDYSIYARVRFQNRERRRRRIWLGVTSLRRDMWITRFERQFPARTPTREWQLLSLELSDLLKRGLLLGAEGPDFLHELRFRSGAGDRSVIEPIEVAYIGLSGLDR